MGQELRSDQQALNNSSNVASHFAEMSLEIYIERIIHHPKIKSVDLQL